MLKKYDKPYPTIGELIKDKNYDYVSYRGYDAKRDIPKALDGEIEGEFCGCFKVINGEIKPLDGDSYSKKETVIYSEEWSMPEEGIEKGLTVIVEMEFVPAEELDEYLKKWKKEHKKKEDGD